MDKFHRLSTRRISRDHAAEIASWILSADTREDAASLAHSLRVEDGPIQPGNADP